MSLDGRLPALLGGVLLFAAAAAAAVLLNLLLLRTASAGNEPVDPVVVHVARQPSVPAAPSWTVRPTTGRIEDGGADD